MKKIKNKILATAILSALSMSSFAQMMYAGGSSTFNESGGTVVAVDKKSTANLNVTASVGASCTVSANNLSFSSISPTTTGTISSTGTITSTCTNSTAYMISLSSGSGTPFARTMVGATSGNTDKLAYQIYTDSAKTKIFGNNTTTGLSAITGTGNGTAQTTTIYGVMNSNQFIKPDTYSDTLSVTFAY